MFTRKARHPFDAILAVQLELGHTINVRSAAILYKERLARPSKCKPAALLYVIHV